ncbi:MAG: hypothetical protein ACYC8T_23490 [Myxococcaceae bacterium]
MFAGRRLVIVVALAGVAALYFGRAWLGIGEPAAPESVAAPDGRAARDEPPAPDAGDRPAVRPLEALFLVAEVSRQPHRPPRVPETGGSPVLRLMATPGTNPIDPERRNEARLRELGIRFEGQTLTFDVKTGGLPVRHDALLRALAALAGPELAGIEFEERSPGGAAGDYELWAYPGPVGEAPSPGRDAGTAGDLVVGAAASPGRDAGAAGDWVVGAAASPGRDAGAAGDLVVGPAASPGRAAGAAGILRATALNFGPWYDLDAVLGLLNVLLEDQGSELRFVCLVASGRFATVLAGPGPGIQAAMAEGLVEVGEASYAMNVGRVEEERDGGPAP